MSGECGCVGALEAVSRFLEAGGVAPASTAMRRRAVEGGRCSVALSLDRSVVVRVEGMEAKESEGTVEKDG